MAISDTHKLRCYNGALRHLGERAISSLSEAREPRRVLDGIWGGNDELITQALGRGDWNFAMRAVKVDYDNAITPEFGFQRAFAKPADFVRLSSLSSDEYFRHPLTNLHYNDEGGFWLADLDVLYVRYVSDHENYGFNSDAWTQDFFDYIEIRMAHEACERLTNSRAKKADLEYALRKALSAAKSYDSMLDGAKFPPRGSWLTARGGGRSGERGSR